MPDIYGNIPTTNAENQIPSFTQVPVVDDNLAPIQIEGQGNGQPIDKAKLAWEGMFQYANQNIPSWASSQQFTSPVIRTPYKETERYLDPNIGYSAIDPDLEVKYGEAHPIKGIFNRLIKTGAGVGVSLLQAANDIGSIFTGNAGVENETDTNLQEWYKRLDQVVLPTYQTLYQRDHPILSYFNPFHLESWLQNVGNVAQQLAPIAGTIASSVLIDSALGVVTDGIADTLLLPRQLERIFTSMDDFGRALTASPEDFNTFTKLLHGSENLTTGVKNALTAARNFRYGANVTRYMLSNATSSYLMSQMIGNQTYNEVKSDLLKQYIDEYGNPQLTEEMRSKIEQTAKDAGNAVLVPNFAFMAISSALGLSSILRPADAAIKATERSLAKDVILNLSETNPNQFIVTPKTYASGLKGFLQRGFNKRGWLVDNVRQSLTMGGFYVSGDATKNFYENKFNIPGTDDVMSLADSYMNSLGKLFTTTEGQESLVLGFLGGAFEHIAKGGINRLRGIDTSVNRLAQHTADTLNKYTLTGLFDVTRQESIASSTIAHDMQEAAATGDIFKYKNLQHEALFNFVSSGEKLHQFDARINQLNSLKTLNKENFETLFNLDFTEQNRKNVESYVDNLINKAHEIRSDIRKVDGAFPPNPFDAKEDAFNYAAYNYYKDELAFNIGRQRDYSRRLKNIKEDVFSKIPSGIFEDVTALSSEEGIGKTIDRFEKRIKELKNSEDLATDPDLKNTFSTEREFLQQKVEELKSPSRNNDPDSFIQTLNSLYDYYGNLNNPAGEFHLDEPTTLQVYNNGVDAYRILGANKTVTDLYRKLAAGDGFDTFKADLYSTLANYRDRIEVKPNGTFSIRQEIPLAEAQTAANTIYKETPTKDEAIAKVDAEDKEFIAQVLDPNHASSEDPNSLGKKIISGEQPITKEIKDEAKQLIEEDFSKPQEPAQKPISTDAVTQQMQELGVIPTIAPTEGNPMDAVYENQDKVIAEDEASTNILDKHWKVNVNPIKLFNKLFSRNSAQAKEQDNVFNIIFTKPIKDLSSFNKTLRIEISDDTVGTVKRSRLPGSKSLYRVTPHNKLVRIYSGKDLLGILNHPETIMFKRGNEYLPLSQFADAAEYSEATGNNPNTFNVFMKTIKDYEKAYNELTKSHKQGDPVVTIDGNRFNSLFDLQTSFGSRDQVDTDADATLIKDLKYKGKGSAILSFPTIIKEDGTYEKVTQPSILNESELTDQEVLDVFAFVDNNAEYFANSERRYFYLSKLPTGKFDSSISIINARLANETEAGLNETYDIITKAINNPESIAQANTDLANKIYISDRNVSNAKSKGRQKGNQINLSVTEDGNLSINVYNPRFKNQKPNPVIIAKDDILATKNFDELSNLIESKFNQAKRDDLILGERLRPVISKTSFKKNALDDEEITPEQAASTLKASVTPQVFRDFSLEFIPKPFYTEPVERVEPEVVSVPEATTLVEIVPDEEYNTFIDKGEVTPERVKEVATKIINQETLSPREVEIFTDKTSDINTEIKNQASENLPVQDKLINDNIDSIVSQLEQKGIAKKNC